MAVGLENLLTDDSRRPIERLRFTQLKKIANAYGLSYDSRTISRDLLIPLIEASGIDVTKPLPSSGERLFNSHYVKKETGQVVQELYPIQKPHASEIKGVDHDAIRERLLLAKEQNNTQISVINKQQEQIDALKEEIERMRADMLGKKTKTQYQQLPHEMPPIQLRSYLKREYGISLPRTANKVDMLEALHKAGYEDND